jgi:hypothetical protein
MGVDKIISTYESSKGLMNIMKNNYNVTFSNNQDKGKNFIIMTNDMLNKMNNLYANNYLLKFTKINPRASTKIGDNSFTPYFISVFFFYFLRYFFIFFIIFFLEPWKLYE